MKRITQVSVLVLLLFGAGCYTENRAIKQVAKAVASKHALAAVDIVREKFPCVPVAPPDSTKFLKSIEALKELLKEKENSKPELDAVQAKHIVDSLQEHYAPSLTELQGCLETTQSLFDYAAELQIRIAKLQKDSTAAKKFRADVDARLTDIQPVVQMVRDSIESAKSAAEISKWKMLYQIDHKWRVDKEAREKGNFVVLIPHLILWVLLVLAGLAALAWWKGFNPLALLRRKKSTT